MTDKLSRIRSLHQEAKQCSACRLSETRTHVVVSSGPPDADVMILGEGPGASEDHQGVPFVGAAGALLNTAIVRAGGRRANCFVTNVVQCRPPGNRDPEPDERASCTTWLRKKIEIVRPKVVIAVGRYAAAHMMGQSDPVRMTEVRGRVYSGVIDGISVVPTWHPVYVNRNRSKMDELVSDIRLALELIK